MDNKPDDTLDQDIPRDTWNCVFIASVMLGICSSQSRWFVLMYIDSIVEILALIVSAKLLRGWKLENQFKMIWSIVQRLNYFLVLIYFSVYIISFLIFKHEYYFYYFFSIITFSIGMQYFGAHRFGLTLILFQVWFL